MNEPHSQPPLEVLPRDLSAYRDGNTGIDYVWRFDSGHPGPHVVVNALTHGNELCGVTALCHLLEHDIRPDHGILTLSFANVAAYQRFDPTDPFGNRMVDRDFNRIWSPEILDSDDPSAEVRRARELRPVYEAADALLDLHSTSFAVHPMLCYRLLPRSREVAAALGFPVHHVVSSSCLHHGPLLFEYGRFGTANGAALALLVECGQHFAARSGEVATATSLRFLAHFGLVDRQSIADQVAKVPPGPAQVYEVTEVVTATTLEFAFSRPVQGFEVFGQGDLIANDGGRQVRAPYDDCALIMPRRLPLQGAEMVTLARRLPADH